MHIDAAFISQQIPHQYQPLVDHADKRIRAAPPGVAVGNLLQQVRFLVKGLAADLDVHGKIRTDIERRIDVDQLKATGILDLFAQRASLQ